MPKPPGYGVPAIQEPSLASTRPDCAGGPPYSGTRPGNAPWHPGGNACFAQIATSQLERHLMTLVASRGYSDVTLPVLGELFMPTRPTRMLCVGKDLDLLQTRCDVLNLSGYDAQSATVPEAELLLLTEKFDLVIVSAFLDDSEKDRILAAAGTMPTLMLRGLTLAPELLGKVQRMLAELEASNTTQIETRPN
jgi:hypothetical protein